MAAEWKEATPIVLEIAEELINQYHDHLLEARVGFIFRSEAPIKDGRATLGKARKIPAEQQIHIPYDFVIWLAEDWWHRLEPNQKIALVDHELCHCGWSNDDKAYMRGHDIEEFNCILERHGYWWPFPEKTVEAVQAALGIEIADAKRRGGVGAVEVKQFRDL